jgi:arylsulfatase A-like enzyme
MKRFPYEGGIRVPFIARWPGHVPAGRKTGQPVVFYDLVALSADLAGVHAPANTDGISFLPTLLDHPERQQQHEYFYWELSGLQGGFQEIRMGDWKAERLNVSRPGSPTVELYNLKADPGQTNNVAGTHPGTVKKLEEIAAKAHTPNLMFPLTPAEAKKAQPNGVTPRKKS